MTSSKLSYGLTALVLFLSGLGRCYGVELAPNPGSFHGEPLSGKPPLVRSQPIHSTTSLFRLPEVADPSASHERRESFACAPQREASTDDTHKAELFETVRELRLGVERLGTGMAQLETGVQQLGTGVEQLGTGMGQLQTGLEEVAANLRVTTLDPNFSVALFGGLVGEAIFAERRPLIPSGILLISPDFGQDTPTVDIHGKQSYIGLGIQGPKICGLQSGGLILSYFYGEDYLADLYGPFVVRAYGELKNDQLRFAIGLEGDVINPLNPGTLDFNTGLGAGNLGFFRGQFRFEHYLHFNECTQLTTQVALGNPIQTSFDGNLLNLLEDNGWPNLDARVALAMGAITERAGMKTRQIELGVSGLIGALRRTGVERSRFDVWGVGADAQVQLCHECGIRGEFFMGQALGNYIGGISQIFDPVTLRAVRTVGGWGEFYVYWKPDLHSHFGGGVDDPLNSTLSEALPTQNAFAFANVIWDVTQNLELGWEVGYWDTDYTPAPSLGPLAPGDNEAMVYRTRVRLKF